MSVNKVILANIPIWDRRNFRRMSAHVRTLDVKQLVYVVHIKFVFTKV